MSHLQAKRRRFHPNTLTHRAADHAISLALSDRRNEGPFLAHNAERDARKILTRSSKTTMARFPRPLYGTALEPNSLEVRFEAERVLDGTYAAALAPTPEDQLLWIDLFNRLRDTISETCSRSARVLDGWRDGEEVAGTAAALGVSVGLIKKLRANIAKEAKLLAGKR